jgi:hypothetical protein
MTKPEGPTELLDKLMIGLIPQGVPCLASFPAFPADVSEAPSEDRHWIPVSVEISEGSSAEQRRSSM